MPIHIEHVQRTFEEHELLDFGKNQSRALAEIEDLEQQKKEANDHFKSAISTQVTAISDLRDKINRGYEIIPTPCDIVLNTPTRGMKSFVCQKTLAVIRVSPMDDRDKQLGLYGTE